MNLALDFDETYTLDPETWNKVIQLFLTSGHKVYCVTKRYEHLSEDIKNVLDIPIIFAPRSVAKMQAVKSVGIKIDVWIDDKPQSIYPYKINKKKLSAFHVSNKPISRWKK